MNPFAALRRQMVFSSWSPAFTRDCFLPRLTLNFTPFCIGFSQGEIMTNTSQQIETHKAMFLDLVAMLSATTMQQMGKIINPMTGKIELNLEAAQATIDMLEMIESKSRGNLDRDEERFLKNSLTTLRMNYVETKAATPTTTSPPAETAPPSAPPTTGEAKEPRFHKTYG